jgi:hypothetical protein
MAKLAGESAGEAPRLDFDRRLMLQFRGSVVTSDAWLLAYREVDDALGFTEMAAERFSDARTGKNGQHALVGMLRQSVFGRLAGYEDVNDAERLRHDPAMRWIVGGKAALGCAALPSQMGRFETRWLATEKNLYALAEVSGQWIDSVHARAARRRARHGFERQPDPWRAGDEYLERPLCLHQLSSRRSTSWRGRAGRRWQRGLRRTARPLMVGL